MSTKTITRIDRVSCIDTPVARIEFKVPPKKEDIENLIYLLRAQALMLNNSEIKVSRSPLEAFSNGSNGKG